MRPEPGAGELQPASCLRRQSIGLAAGCTYASPDQTGPGPAQPSSTGGAGRRRRHLSRERSSRRADALALGGKAKASGRNRSGRRIQHRADPVSASLLVSRRAALLSPGGHLPERRRRAKVFPLRALRRPASDER